MTVEELRVLLDTALDSLHDIGSALTARKLLTRRPTNEVILQSLEEKAWSDERILNEALDTWEVIVSKLHELGDEKVCPAERGIVLSSSKEEP